LYLSSSVNGNKVKVYHAAHRTDGKKLAKFLSENPGGKIHLGTLRFDKHVLLKRMLRKQGVKVWTEVNARIL
jgi:hypothetical protein